MKQNFFFSNYKVYHLKYRFPKFETFSVKIDDCTSSQSHAIFPSKMVFELRGQSTIWQKKTLTSLDDRRSNSVIIGNSEDWIYSIRGNVGANVLLVLLTSKVVSKHRSHRAQDVSVPERYRLWEENGCSWPADTDTILKMQLGSIRRFVRQMLKNHVMSETYPY